MYKNRREAGKALAERLSEYRQRADTVVLGIPRGGVVVAYEVARNLDLPLDVVVIKKIGMPANEELAAGAASLEDYILNESVVDTYRIPESYLHDQIGRKQAEARERYEFLRGDSPPYQLRDKAVIIIDDGLATGTTMTMAVQIIRKSAPREVVVAVPVAPPETILQLGGIADRVVCPLQPGYFAAIGQFYEEFYQVTDEEAKRLLQEIRMPLSSPQSP